MPTNSLVVFVFFFNDKANTAIYTLSLHDALPIFRDETQVDTVPACRVRRKNVFAGWVGFIVVDEYWACGRRGAADRKSTRLNSSHLGISYAVFCLKKKKKRSGVVQELRRARARGP